MKEAFAKVVSDNKIEQTLNTVDASNIHDCFINTTVSSFILLMCIKGNGIIVYDGGTCAIILGETILLTACMGKFTIDGTLTLLSIYMQ